MKNIIQKKKLKKIIFSKDILHYNKIINKQQQIMSVCTYTVPNYFIPGVYNPTCMFTPTKHMYCRYVNITIPGDWMKHVIGSNGYYFYVITHQSNVSYIWYHNHIKMIEIWASSYDALNDAENRLKNRMNHICLKMLYKSGMIDDEGKRIEKVQSTEVQPKETIVKKVRWSDVEDDE